MSEQPTKPYGGELVNLLMDHEQKTKIKDESIHWPSWQLTPRQLGDVELLITGGFSPLRGFLCRKDYDNVLQDMHLSDGTFWPIPVTLDISEDLARGLSKNDKLVLRDLFGVAVAILTVEDLWQPGLTREAENVYGTDDPLHPGVAYLREHVRRWYVGGDVRGIERPLHYDFSEIRLSPEQVRSRIQSMGWKKVIAYDPRKPMHRAQVEQTISAMNELGAKLLINPTVGQTKTGDVEHFARVRCYQSVIPRYPKNHVLLSLLPFSSRFAGPREAALLAIIHRNHGCTHMLIYEDLASPFPHNGSRRFYKPDEAYDLCEMHKDTIGIIPLPCKTMVYLPSSRRWCAKDQAPSGEKTQSLSQDEISKRLERNEDIPESLSYPEVLDELRKARPPRLRQGFTVFCTGLPSAGKSTVAQVLMIRLLESGNRPVTLLDGDIVRTHLSSELGFSRHDRDLNIRRIGFVASEITKNGGVAICAPIAPYDTVRREVREMIEAKGGFILVHISTPVSVCEKRDRKGLYAKARAGLIKEFTGVSDPYEPPNDAQVEVDTSESSPVECTEKILDYLRQQGYL